MDGAELIEQERKHQYMSHEWSDEHDDGYTTGALAIFGACYALDAVSNYGDSHESWNVQYREAASRFFPFDAEWWKPTPGNPIRQLVKAGALIAAEIDRLQRAKKK